MTLCVFRVDAMQAMGTGHLMRCLTLADALAAHGVRSRFVCRHIPASLAALLAQRGHELIELPARNAPASLATLYAQWLGTTPGQDAADTIGAIGSDEIAWLVVDHYALDREWETAVRPHVRRLLAIDDLADRDHACDVLLDQNLYRDMDERYAKRLPDGARALLGPHYALLREEFRRERVNARPRDGELRRVLVFFGGADDADHTTAALEGLIRASVRAHVDVVIGAGHRSRERIETLCRENGFDLHVQISNMAELMARADLALGAGGTATWERCCVGLPALVLAVAENQRALVRDAAAAGLIYAPQLERFSADAWARHVTALAENPLLLQTLSTNAMRCVDGFGASRVVRAMGLGRVRMRPATREDSRNLFEWRNHPAIRQASRSTAAIEWTTHCTWLDAVLADANRVLLIAEFEGAPAGVVRFDIAGESAEVSIYKTPDRSTAAGAELLGAAEEWLQRHRADVRSLVAEVLGGNQPSHALFSGAGYTRSVTRYTKRIGS